MLEIREMQKITGRHPPGLHGGGIHPFHEMLSLLRGQARVHWMGVTCEAQAPALFLLPANTPHMLQIVSADCAFGYIELEGEESDAFAIARARSWNGRMPAFSSELAEQEHAHELAAIRQAHQFMWEQFPYPGLLAERSREIVVWDVLKLLTLIGGYLDGLEHTRDEGKRRKASQAKKSKERLLPVIRWMESSYQQPLTVRELARQANMEQSHFIRSFKRLTGKPPLQYVLELRLHAACSYLQATTLPIQEIARLSGFPNLHYFSKLFKLRYGLSPSAYREAGGSTST